MFFTENIIRCFYHRTETIGSSFAVLREVPLWRQHNRLVPFPYTVYMRKDNMQVLAYVYSTSDLTANEGHVKINAGSKVIMDVG